MNIAREFGSEIDRVSFHWAIAIKLIPVGFCLFEDDKFIHPYLINHSVLGTRTLTDVDYVVCRIGDFSTIIPTFSWALALTANTAKRINKLNLFINILLFKYL